MPPSGLGNDTPTMAHDHWPLFDLEVRTPRLTLRYLDDLTVPECADALGKSVHATESLLVRARAAFRTTYELTGGRDDD